MTYHKRRRNDPLVQCEPVSDTRSVSIHDVPTSKRQHASPQTLNLSPHPSLPLILQPALGAKLLRVLAPRTGVFVHGLNGNGDDVAFVQPYVVTQYTSLVIERPGDWDDVRMSSDAHRARDRRVEPQGLAHARIEVWVGEYELELVWRGY